MECRFFLERNDERKGILDRCLLAIIKNKEMYGYELAEKLGEYGFCNFSEGTIYPQQTVNNVIGNGTTKS